MALWTNASTDNLWSTDHNWFIDNPPGTGGDANMTPGIGSVVIDMDVDLGSVDWNDWSDPFFGAGHTMVASGTCDFNFTWQGGNTPLDAITFNGATVTGTAGFVFKNLTATSSAFQVPSSINLVGTALFDQTSTVDFGANAGVFLGAADITVQGGSNFTNYIAGTTVNANTFTYDGHLNAGEIALVVVGAVAFLNGAFVDVTVDAGGALTCEDADLDSGPVEAASYTGTLGSAIVGVEMTLSGNFSSVDGTITDSPITCVDAAFTGAAIVTGSSTVFTASGDVDIASGGSSFQDTTFDVDGDFTASSAILNGVQGNIGGSTCTAVDCIITNCDFSGGAQLNATDGCTDGTGNTNVDFGTFALVVVGGTDLTGTSPYLPGTEVSIEAGAPDAGFAFKEWTGDTAGLDSTTNPTPTLTMPSSAVTITATYEAVYALSMSQASDLTGGSPYVAGATVTARAADPDNGTFRFHHWECDVGDADELFDDIHAVETTFTMPANDVTAHAVFIVWHELTLVAGVLPDDGDATSDNVFLDDVVNIQDVAPAEGIVFDHWESSDGGSFGDANASPTTFTMPDNDTTVTAWYVNLQPSSTSGMFFGF